MATSSLWSTSIEVGMWDTSDRWAACPLSTLESALNNSAYVPANATVTKVVLHVSASWWCQGGSSANGYIRYGIGGTSSINKELVGKTSISGGANENNVYEYPSGGYDITSLLNTKVAPNVKFKTDNGSYLTFCFISPNNLKKRFHVKSVTLDITYHTHSYTSSVIANPTCDKSGTRRYTCSCGAYYDESIPALGHSYDSGVITKQPTCTEKGVKTYTCQNDSSHKYTEDIPAKGHTWVNATCTTPKTCSVCGATEGQPLGHDYKSTVIDPTSTANGYTEHVCSRCGDSYRNSYTCRVYGMGEPLNTGSVKIDGGSNLKIVNQGDEVTLLAGGANGYAFKQWNDGNTENPRTVKVTNSVTYTAIYEEIAKPPVYVNGNRCHGIYIDEENKKIIFRSDDAMSQISDAIDTVDGWHFETIWAAPPAGTKAVKKIYIGTTQIY